VDQGKRVILLRRKICLDTIVRCNILPIMRAVELRSVQAVIPWPVAKRRDIKEGEDGEES
jgi:hypothetical protein